VTAPLARGRALPGVALALLLPACTGAPPGKLLAQGPARGLVASASGASLAFLQHLERPAEAGVPDDLHRGELLVARAGESARKAGGAVPDLAGSVAFEPGGEALAFLAGWRFREGQGELWVARPGEAPARLAQEASAFAWSPRGNALAFVAAGTLRVVSAGGAPIATGAAPVHTFAWSPDGRFLAGRAPAAAHGRLVLLANVQAKERGAEREIAPASSDFAFAPDGALAVLGAAGPKGGDRVLSLFEPGDGKPRELGYATSFDFSPTGSELAVLSTGKEPGEASGELSLVPRARGSLPRALGSKVSEWRWSPAGDLLYLARFDLRSRSGTLFALASGAGQEPRALSARVQGFSVAGRRALFLVQQPLKGDFKIELWTADLAAAFGSPRAEPRKVDEGVYGYQLSPDGALLYWKSRCVGLRSCALFRAPADGSGGKVELMPAAAGFDLSRDGARLLVAQPHRGSRALDLFLLDARGSPPTAPPKPLLEAVEPGAILLDEGGHQVAAVLSEPAKAGVVVVRAPSRR
jgi:dipeptidyl aminopeptidase/acylaminoacyl peptidase